MTNRQIAYLCKGKEKKLLNKYFGNLVKDAALERPETIGEYMKDLPLKIESEYKSFFEELWKEVAPEELKSTPLVLEEQKLRKLMTSEAREGVDAAYKDAMEQTLWERITKTNHKDVTSDVELPQELVNFGEQIAKNVHDVWFIGRIKEGWTYGPDCNDIVKKHPCLVPYEELPESEKEYNRQTA